MTRQYLYAGPCPNCQKPMEAMVRRERKPGEVIGQITQRHRHEDDKSPAHYEGCQRPREIFRDRRDG